MESIRNFCNPPIEQLEIEVVHCIMNEVSVARRRGEWIKVVALTIITELAAIFCAITNVFTTLGLAAYEGYSRGFEAAGQMLINGVKAEGYILAIAVAFTGIVIFASETLPDAGRQLGNAGGEGFLQLRQRTEARIRDLVTEQVAYQREIDQLNARIRQLEGENRRFQEARPVVNRQEQEETIRGLRANIEEIIRERELEVSTRVDEAVIPLRNQIEELRGRIRDLEMNIHNLNGDVGRLEGEKVGVLSRLQEQGDRLNGNAYAALMRNRLEDTEVVQVTVGELKRLKAS